MSTSDTVEVWTYIGRRTGAKSPVVFAWQDLAGADKYFRKNLCRHAAIGGSYEVTVEPNDDGGMSVIGEARYIGPAGADEQTVLEWHAKDRIAADRDAVRKQSARAKDVDPLREALLPLRRIMDGRLSHNDKYALVAAVSAEMWRPLTQAEKGASS